MDWLLRWTVPAIFCVSWLRVSENPNKKKYASLFYYFGLPTAMGVNLDRTYEVIDKLNRAATSQDICDALTSFTGRYGLTCMRGGSENSDRTISRASALQRAI